MSGRFSLTGIQMTLAEIMRAAEGIDCKWSKMPDPTPDSKAYAGKALFWNILVVQFDVAGGKGYDGKASGKGTVVRLPRPVAEDVFNIALKEEANHA